MIPRVSICIPTYNGEKYLRACLDSVTLQTYPDFEVLIVDDQSADTSVDIALEYAKRDSRIRIVQNEKNLGLVGNWNRCIELARGEWIKFVFQDDVIHPTCLEGMMLANSDGYPLVVCNREFLFEEDVKKEEKEFLTRLPSLNDLFSGKNEISAREVCINAIRHIGVNFIGEPTAVLLQRSVFDRYGMFNPNLVQICDLEYWIRIGSQTGLVYVPQLLASFRVHGLSASSTNQSGRAYRSEALDPLILLHEYLFNSAYDALREVAYSDGSLGKLRKLLNKWAHWSYASARSQKARLNSPDPKPMEEWLSIFNAYPRMFNSNHFRFEEFKHILDKHFLWRFRKHDANSIMP